MVGHGYCLSRSVSMKADESAIRFADTLRDIPLLSSIPAWLAAEQRRTVFCIAFHGMIQSNESASPLFTESEAFEWKLFARSSPSQSSKLFNKNPELVWICKAKICEGTKRTTLFRVRHNQRNTLALQQTAASRFKRRGCRRLL